MARTGPDPESIKQSFLLYIKRGKDIEAAKSLAGVNDDNLVIEWLTELHADGSHEGVAEIEAAQAALSTLKDLCITAETDETRCAAARALLQYVGSRQRNRTSEKTSSRPVQVQVGESLWDFAK